MSRGPTVSLSELLELRGGGLNAYEIWSLLHQSALALETLLRSGDLQTVAPDGSLDIRIDRSGLVRLEVEKILDQNDLGEIKREKLWIFALGRILFNALDTKTACSQKLSELPHIDNELHSLLSLMTKEKLNERPLIQTVLHVIESYKKAIDEKPYIMNLYKEVLGSPLKQSFESASMKSAVENETPRSRYQNKRVEGESLKNFPFSAIRGLKVQKRRHPVQRAASRLYRAPQMALVLSDGHQSGKAIIGNQCVGPEFIVRSKEPACLLKLDDSSDQKMLNVLLLNGRKLQIVCHPRNTISKIFEAIVQSEDLTDNYMLGLCDLQSGDFVFLPADWKLKRLAPEGWIQNECQWLIYLRFKLYLPNLRGIRDPITRHLLYLQLRRSLLDRQISCTDRELVDLGGLALQAEFGDYIEKEHGSEDYFLREHYLPELSGLGSDELREAHKLRKGVNRNQAEELFVTAVQRLFDYGHHYQECIWARSGKPLRLFLSVCLDGICLTEWRDGRRRCHEWFDWKRIEKLSFTKRTFGIVPKDIAGQKATRYKLAMNRNKSLFFFRLASFHHNIFLRLRMELCTLRDLAQQFGVPYGKENAPAELENVRNSTKEKFLRRSSACVVETKMCDSFFNLNLAETLSTSLHEKLINLSCDEERLLIKIILERDKYGSLGLEVTEGNASQGVYVRNVFNSGMIDVANAINNCSQGESDIRRGDQIIAVNGICLLAMDFANALATISTAGNKLELVVARSVNPKQDYLRNIRFDMAFESDNFALTDVPNDLQ